MRPRDDFDERADFEPLEDFVEDFVEDFEPREARDDAFEGFFAEGFAAWDDFPFANAALSSAEAGARATSSDARVSVARRRLPVIMIPIPYGYDFR